MSKYKIVPEVVSGNRYYVVYKRSSYFFWSYISLYSDKEGAEAAIQHLNSPAVYV